MFNSNLRTFLLLCVVLVIECQFVINQSPENDLAKKSLPFVLKFLNDDAKANINYHTGRLVHSQLKGDILEIYISTLVSCKASVEFCPYDSADCRALLFAPPDGEIQVLSVDCNPNKVVIEEPLALPIKIQDCTGCLNDIKVDAPGVEQLVKTIVDHVQSEKNQRYSLTEVLKVQQQVVNGVKFVLTVKIAPEKCNLETLECVKDKRDDLYCVVTFYQEPGFQKPKNIVSNNCTESQTFLPTLPKFPSSDSNKVTTDEEKPISKTKYTSDRTENEIMDDLISQIIPLEDFEGTPKKNADPSQLNSMRPVESSTFQEVVATEDEPISIGTDNNVASSSEPFMETDADEAIIEPSEEPGIVTTVGNEANLEIQQMSTRRKRSTVGSESLTPKEKAGIHKVLGYIAETLDAIDDDRKKRVVLEVISLKKVHSDDLHLNLNLKIGVSECDESKNEQGCLNKLIKDETKFCKIRVKVDEEFSNPKIIKSHCENEKQEKIRNKRGLLGGRETIDVNDPKVKQYLNEAVNYVNSKLSKGDKLFGVNRILWATSQVVQGDSYDIKIELNDNCEKKGKCSGADKICDINVWERSWLNSRIITIACGGDPKLTFDALQSTETKSRKKRQTLVGGHTPVSQDDPRLAKHLKSLLPKLDSQSEHEHKLKVVQVLSATSQVVAGTNWVIKAKLGLSDCLKSDSKDVDSCSLKSGSTENVCTFKFWEKLPNKDGVRDLESVVIECDQPKLNYRSTREVHARKRREILFGGFSSTSENNPEIIKHLGKLLPKLDAQSEHEHKLKVSKILSASSQVVAGTNWVIKAELSPSDCLKSDPKNVESCGLQSGSAKTICTFKFWEKLPNKDGVSELANIEVECDQPKLNYRNTREIHFRQRRDRLVGGFSPVSENDSRLVSHLGKLLPKLDSQSEHQHKLKVVKVLSASSQVVAGTNWVIKAKLAQSDCLKSDAKDVENCGLKSGSTETVCTFKFWEILPDKNGVREFENIEVTCDEPKLNYRSTREIHSRKRRDTLPGGFSPVSANDSRLVKHLGKLLPKLDSQSEHQHKLKVVKVLSASSQVVAGTNWVIKAKLAQSDCLKSDAKDVESCGLKSGSTETVCTFKFWEKLPDQNGVRELDNIEVTCDEPKLNYRSTRDTHSRKRRDTLVGGFSPVSENDSRLVKHLGKLLPKLDSQSEHEHKLKVLEILSASSQVVAGTNWIIKAKLGVSDCLKTDSKDVQTCGLKSGSTETICTFKFWEKLPNKERVRELENIKVECDQPQLNYRNTREIHSRKRRDTFVGGFSPVSENDSRLVTHLGKLLPKLDSQSEHQHKLKVVEILSASSQVVAGTNWVIKAKLGVSDCFKSDSKDVQTCGLKSGSTETICTFKFWEKLPNKESVRKLEHIKVECDQPKLNYRSTREIHSRKRRDTLIGGFSPVSENDSRLVKHLGKLLPKLDSQSEHEHKLKVVEILSASSQVVAGTNWIIKAKLGVSDCLKSDSKDIQTCGLKSGSTETICTFKFWEKLPNKESIRELENIKVECDQPKLNYRSTREIHSRKRRDTLVGGFSPVSENDSRLVKHLGKLLPKLDSQSEHEHKLKVVEILSASSQVVAGTNWIIKAKLGVSDCLKSDSKDVQTCGLKSGSTETICTFKFWEKLPNKERVRELENIKVECDQPKLNYRTTREIHSRKRRDTLVGGFSPVSENDARLVKHLGKLLPKLDSQSEHQHKLKVVKVLSASSQVVAGTNWVIKAKLAQSDCLKSDSKDVESCGLKSGSTETICTFKFWERLPEKDGNRELDDIQVDCDEPKLKYRTKRGAKGAPKDVDKNDPTVYEYITKSLQQIDLNSPEENKHKVNQILSATKQTVAGTLWKIRVSLILSDCLKSDSTNWDQCGELQGTESKLCTIKVVDRPWDKQPLETTIDCDNQKKNYTFRSKRSLIERDQDQYITAFMEFEKKYNKRYYSPKHRNFRFSVFKSNMKYIDMLNDYEQGTAVYGVTEFADLSREEFSQRLGYRSDLANENEIEFQQAEIPDIKLPESFDWREKKAVTVVKDQGSCGSCWAFSVTGNVEGQYAIKNGELLQFSEQELIDCDKVDQGCNGGLMDNAYRQIEKLGGLEQEKNYPYEARDDRCHFKESLVKVQLSSAVNISSDETDMAKWLVQNGPISIAINANAMQFYVGGVSHPWKFLCKPSGLDHGVLIVGYGVHTYPKFNKTLPYWIVKNSWGPSWGEQGYYRVYRGDGTCGVNQTPSSAILK